MCFPKRRIFEKHIDFVKMLDSGQVQKQSQRSYLFLKIKYEENNVYIPLRRNLGLAERVFGKIGFSVPAKSKPNAGLDYRYMLIVNDDTYVEKPTSLRIPTTQYKIICENYGIIEREAIAYIKGYVKTAVKDRVGKEAKYRESSLANFHIELRIDEKIEKRRKQKAYKELQLEKHLIISKYHDIDHSGQRFSKQKQTKK